LIIVKEETYTYI